MSRLNVGVIGCGAHATLYQIPALRQSRLATLAAVVDTDQTWGHSVAKRFGLPLAYTDARALIGKVDAAIIATPNFTHVALATLLLEHGIHVLCEKPVCTSGADLARIAASADRSGARFVAAHCLRFSANLLFMKRMIDQGWLGDISAIRGTIGGPYEQASHRTDFRKSRNAAGGGVLADLGIHLIDLSLWLTGEKPRVAAYTGDHVRGWEVEDNADVTLHFPGGSEAQLSCSFTQALGNTVTVRGAAGWAEASLYVPTRLDFYSERIRMCRSDGMQSAVLDGPSMYLAQLNHFCEVVTGEAPAHVPLHQVGWGIEVIEQCYDEQSCTDTSLAAV